MKKNLLIASVFAAALFAASCSKEEVKDTAAVGLAGDWYVTCDGYSNDGTISMEDPFDIGRFHIITANTAKDVTNEMILADPCDDSFWNFRCKIAVDPDAGTFSAQDVPNFVDDNCTITVTGGQIVLGGATTPSGQPADYIEFHIIFSDDQYIGRYWDDLIIKGYRYSGFAADEGK